MNHQKSEKETKKVDLNSIKTELHPRNKHNKSYNFDELSAAYPPLKAFVAKNKYGNFSIDFFDPEAVRCLNTALLMANYQISYWEIPEGYLCPPVPGRADYVHYVADVLGIDKNGKIPKGNAVKILDIGVGANCIYPIIGSMEYGWKFIGTDTETTALAAAQKIVDNNPNLKDKIELRKQQDVNRILFGVIKPNEQIDLVMCNPPFYRSADEAKKETLKKLSNLKRQKITKAVLNFGGQTNELWCKGGEIEFIKKLIEESKVFAQQCKWFTCIVSKQSHLPVIISQLKRFEINEYQITEMGQGNKITRFVAWRF